MRFFFERFTEVQFMAKLEKQWNKLFVFECNGMKIFCLHTINTILYLPKWIALKRESKVKSQHEHLFKAIHMNTSCSDYILFAHSVPAIMAEAKQSVNDSRIRIIHNKSEWKKVRATESDAR